MPQPNQEGYKISFTDTTPAAFIGILDEDGYPFPPPKGMYFQSGVDRVVSVSGKEYFTGSPKTEWHFEVLTPDMVDFLLAPFGTSGISILGQITTRLPNGTYSTYRCLIHKPDLENATFDNSVWKDVVIRFTHLEAASS